MDSIIDREQPFKDFEPELRDALRAAESGMHAQYAITLKTGLEALDPVVRQILEPALTVFTEDMPRRALYGLIPVFQLCNEMLLCRAALLRQAVN
ncbi:MAG TPA: hypothetical protein VMB85_16715 [Bryobacteraceae bacterium]|nr:hypothetical protein [Bryobacteraceae bacterium]